MGADGFTFGEHEARLSRAANGLADSEPLLSARDGLTKFQKRSLAALFVILVIAISTLPRLIFWLGYFIFAALILWRATLITRAKLYASQSTPPKLSDEALPAYSILVALYDEARSLPGLIAALRAIDYPTGKLDIHLLLEAGDRPTLEVLSGIELPEHFFVHTLAPGDPQTKPRALNYGLECAAGKYLTIYDAEDCPHPRQLREAAEMFAASPSNTACLQAPLRAHNCEESWIAAHWALEYDIQFGLLVPAKAEAGFPIPLGGTSNHFSREILEISGGWDAWNVTEDADLGIRFARTGFRVASILSPTLEEAPESMTVWAAQRSRWIKGFLQSWLVVMRQPVKALRQMGIRNWLAMQLTLGGAIFSAICAGPMAVWLLLCLLLPGLKLGAAGLWLLCCGYGVNVIAALAAPGKWSARRLLTVATLPLYWPLLTLGAARALYGLARTPHFWAKTPHGLTAARMEESSLTCHSTGSSLSVRSQSSARLPSSQTGKPASHGMT